MFEACRSDLDEVGKLEASLERSRRDASVEILSLVRIIGALAGHGELVLLRHDLDVVGSEPCDRQGDAEAVIAKLHNIEERSEEHTSELQSLMRISYAVFCLKKKIKKTSNNKKTYHIIRRPTSRVND